MTVFSETPRTAARTVYLLPHELGAIFGRLFPRNSDVSTSKLNFDLDVDSAEVISRSGGRRLIEDYWGSYVAFLNNPYGGKRYVIRSCSGWLPCYRMAYEDVEIVFSDIGDLVPLQLPPFTLNLNYLASFIYQNQLQIRECGYTEVRELLAGECLEFTRESRRQFPLWDPRRVVLSNCIDDYEVAERDLRRITDQCVGAWSAVSDNVLLSLSGGFDSAVVLGCTKRASIVPNITCFNQFMEGTADDERRFARLAATRVDVKLIEQPWSSSRISDRLVDLPKAPKPSAGDLEWWLEVETRNGIARSIQADAIWTGQGGDHLFWAPRNFPVAADYVERRGIDFGFPRVVRDAARLFGDSYLSVILTALRLGWSDEPWNPDWTGQKACRFVNRDALPRDLDEYIAHPWASSSHSGIPKTKQAQILFLADVLNRHRHLPRAEYAYQEHPLLSQPLIELCLQIPIYLLVRGGRRRAMARRAFRDVVPAEIGEREDKGDTTVRARALIRDNQPFLRDLILNGILASAGIISRAAVEQVLTGGQCYREEDYWPLRACVTAEIWAQSRKVGHV